MKIVTKMTDLDHVLLPKSVLKTLTLNNVTTILEFIQQDTEKLATITKLSLSQILEIRNDIFMKYAAPLINGPSLLTKSKMRKRFLNTGIESLNAVLGGGIPVGYITEICGLTGSGKTQICFQIAINCSRKTENIILYIDTKGDFAAIRIQKVLDNLGYTHQEIARNLFNIKIVHIWTMVELIDFFKKLKNKALSIQNLALIIIDSLPCLLMQHFGDENKIGLTYLNILVNYCRYVCKNYDIGIVCVNIQTRWVEHNVSDFEDREDQTNESSYVETYNRCLGKYWQHIPAHVLLIEKIKLEHINSSNNGFSVKSTVIRSHNGFILGQQCTLNVDSSGVR